MPGMPEDAHELLPPVVRRRRPRHCSSGAIKYFSAQQDRDSLAVTNKLTGGHVASLGQFEDALTEAGAEAAGIKRGPEGERLVITIGGGLITKEVPLTDDLLKDIERAKAAAARSVTVARSLTGVAARNLSNRLATKGVRLTT
jgi:hypothetical protein